LLTQYRTIGASMAAICVAVRAARRSAEGLTAAAPKAVICSLLSNGTSATGMSDRRLTPVDPPPRTHW
jgi:hypothetical protein